jgi:acetylornithine deacetylase/succinyl-diaminopimelate desuccinylase-like protein
MKIFTFFIAANILFFTSSAQTVKLTKNQILAHDILKELVEINTTHSTGNTTVAVEAIAKRLIAGGFTERDFQILGPEDRNKNLVLRWNGSGKGRPILFIAHLDVVEAKKTDWTTDPFSLIEKDGYFYGRGVLDLKGGAANLVANFIRLKQEGYIPDRDLILALTAGEEVGDLYNGVDWLINNHRALIDAGFCVNMESGYSILKNGKRVALSVQISEKGYINLQLEVKNPGGHSSMPSNDNAIYRLAKGLTNLSVYHFPAVFNPTTKSFFYSMSLLESGQLSADLKAVSVDKPDTEAVNRLSNVPMYNAKMRNTCVATMLEAGHQVSALPQTAIARVNCRIMPGGNQDDIVQKIKGVLMDSQIVVTVTDSLSPNPASELNAAQKKIVEEVTEKLWPKILIIPNMTLGGTDGKYLREAGIPTYGISGVGVELGENRVHGKDERVLISQFYEGLDFEYALIKALSSAN